MKVILIICFNHAEAVRKMKEFKAKHPELKMCIMNTTLETPEIKFYFKGGYSLRIDQFMGLNWDEVHGIEYIRDEVVKKELIIRDDMCQKLRAR